MYSLKLAKANWNITEIKIKLEDIKNTTNDKIIK